MKIIIKTTDLSNWSMFDFDQSVITPEQYDILEKIENIKNRLVVDSIELSEEEFNLVGKFL